MGFLVGVPALVRNKQSIACMLVDRMQVPVRPIIPHMPIPKEPLRKDVVCISTIARPNTQRMFLPGRCTEKGSAVRKMIHEAGD